MDIKELIATQKEHTAGALMALYSLQTSDEKTIGTTVHQNSVGFSSADSDICSSMARQFQERGTLTDRQVSFLQRCLPKYIRQIETYGYCPAEFETVAQKPQAEIPVSMKADSDGEKFILSFSFPKGDFRFVKTLDRVKTLSGRRWNPDKKVWTVPVSYDSAAKLKEWGFELSGVAQKAASPVKNEIQLDQSLLDPRLFAYQKEGVQFVESRNGSALIGDDQGLGKTCQALSWLSLHPEVRPALIVCPAALKLNWEKEVGFWVKSKCRVHVISGKKPSQLPRADIYIINYDILGDAKYNKDKKTWKLSGWVEYLSTFGFQSIVCDEIQRIKADSQRARACLYLSKTIPRHIALSGTPLKNRAAEIFNPITFVDPKVFPSFWKFVNEFTHVENNGFGYQFKGVKNSERLHKILTDTIMIRRKKEDVLTQLPPKTRAVIPLEITNKKEYAKIIKEFQDWCKGTWVDKAGNLRSNLDNPAAKMVEISKLRQATIAGKMDMAVEWVEEFLESDKKLILFATHTRTLDILQEKFGNICVRLDGGTKAEMRQEVVNQFQNDPEKKLFLGNIIAAGEGITLTASQDVAFIELDWVPSNHLQAEDRAHRIGQAGNVTCWYLTAAGTIEDKLAELLVSKIRVIGQVLDGKKETEETIFDELFRRAA